ncbi:MAG TPA: hypothetical protein VEQ58_08580 [Polyangiaceae bacterium]|nr:hypothetical protein [Polyangiaceae bacterium]
MFPSTGLERRPSASLAPDDQAEQGSGGGSLDLGELLALFNPPAPSDLPAPPASPPSPQSPGVADVAQLLERWVRRVAVGGDQRRGVARLDIGTGRFAGSELVVMVEAGQVSVDLRVPEALDPSLAERLRSRLERRGYAADVVVR